MNDETETARLLLNVPVDLKERVEASADTEGLSVSAWAERVFEANVATGEGTVEEQHTEARKLLPLLFEATRERRFVTYDNAAKWLGRELPQSVHMIRAAADLVDAAAVLTAAPMIALGTLLPDAEVHGNADVLRNLPELRVQLIDEARKHSFTQTDIANIEAKLNTLYREGKGNKAAWRQVKKTMPRFEDVRV